FLKPNIQITKTVDKDNASPGDSLLYKINIKNTGDGSARNFSLQDPVPSGLIIDANSITDGPPPGTGTTITGMTHSVNGNTIEWQISNPPDNAFPAGAETTLSFRVLVSNTASGTICNSPLILNSECCYQNYQIPTNACTKITATPIKVTKSIVEVNGQPAQDPVRLQPGDIVRFRIKVENKGTLPVYNVDVYDTLPTGFVYQSNSSRYQRTNGSVPTTWTSAQDPNTSPYQTPPPPPPGFSGYQWHIQQTLEGTDDNGGTTGSSLDTLYLEFLAKVTTNAPASPIGSYAVNVGDVSCTTDMQGNTPIDRSVIDTSSAKAWALVYKPQLQIYKSVYSINGNTSDTTRVQPGDTVRYKIQVKNTSGYGLAIAVVTTDTLPTGFTYINGTTSATWTGGSSTSNPTISGNQLTFSFNNQAQIAPGDSLVIYYSVRVASSASLGKNCNSSSAQGRDLDNGTISAFAPDGSGSSSACVDVYKPVLRVTKLPQSYIATVGNPVTFIVKIENLDSYAQAKSINLSEVIPSGWNYVSGSSYKVKNNGALPSNWGSPITEPTQTGQTLTFNLNETLLPTDDSGGTTGTNQDTLWIKFNAVPTNASPGCANKDTVTVTYQDNNNGSYTPVTDEANVCVCSPKLEMDKSADLTEARVNEEVTFTLKVSNKNPVDAFNVNVQDYLPPGWVYVSGSGKYQRTNGSSPNPSNWTLLEPAISGDTLVFNTNITVEGTDDSGGATGTKLDTLFVEFKAKPTQNAIVGLNVNRAIAEGKDAGNNPIGSNEDDAQVTVRKPEISISKSVDKSAANVGDTLTYTITITNSGNLDLINATITDTLPDGVTYLSGGSYSPPNIVTFTGLTIPQGSSISEQITVKINKNVENGSILINRARVDGSDSYGNTYSSGPATAQTQVNAPKLLITKSSTPNPVKAGENITYTITVTNSGSAPATNVVITDPVPQHTTFVSADSGGQNTGGVVTWNIATLDANSQITVHFVVKVDSPIADNTIIENTAIVNSNEQGPINSDKVINVVSSVPQLVLCKSDSQDPVKPGNQFTYTIRYANNSTMNVTNVVIADTLPSGITYISANPTPTSVNGQIITWNIGNLPAGSSGNITLTVQVDQSVPNGTKVTNTVIATSNETPQAQATEDTLIGTLPNLTISKSDSVDPVQAGSQFTYTIRYQNTGGQDATNVVITDTLPNGLTFISATPAPTSVNGQTLTWNIGTLQSGTLGQITVKVEVPIDTPNGTIFTNTATITSTETNPVTTSETTTVESKPVLTISKDVQTTHNPAQPGDIATYTITYGNTGNLTATNTFIVDAIPQNTRFVVGSVTAPSGVTVQYSSDNGATWTYTPVAGSDGTDPNVTHIKWTIGNLNPGVINQQVTFQVKINSPLPNGTVISNTASIDSDQTSPVNASKNFVVGSSPSIHITKTSDKNSVQAGDTLTYTIDYYNDGNMDATGVVITETYDPNVDFVSATPQPDTGKNNVWTIGTLPADGTHHTITITVKVKSPLPNGTTIHNIVTIDSDQTDPQQATKDVVVGSAPILTIVKTDTPDPVQAGDNLIYTITVGNTGNAPATNVVVTDTTPPHTTFVSARFVSRTGSINAPQVGATGTVTFTLSGTLNQNEEFVVELIVKVDTPLNNNTTITNTAKVTSTEDSQGKESQTTTTVQSAPILSIDKVDTQDPVTAGSNITYRITVKNTGNMVAHNVIITDSTPQNTTFVSAQFIQGTGTITSPPQGGTGSITFAITSINKDETVIVELVVKTNSPLPNGTQITNTASVKSDEIQTPLQDTETTTIGSAPVLNISKTSSPNPVSAGDNITYTITVTNNGNMDATQFVITDSTPANTTFVSARFVSGATGTITSPPVGGTGTITWNPNPATLPVHATVVVELIVKTNSPLPSGTIITNTAFADSAETQQVSATNTTTVSGLPKLVITKSVYPTEQAPSGLVFYSITITNTGNAAATNVTVTETYPSEVSFYYANPQPSSGNNVWIIPRIDAGATYTITIVVKVKENVPLTTPPVKVTNTASVTCAEIPAPQSASASFEVRAANFWDPAHVTQKKEVDPKGTVSPGTWLTYTNYFGNSGNAPAINVKIVDPVDSNLDETTLQISDGNLPDLGITVTHSYDPVRREITWTIPNLPPNTTGWVSFRAMARATLTGSTIITNTTRISADNAPEEVSTNTVYTYVVAPCPTTPTPPTPPTPPTAINLTFNVPDTICASSFSKFVLTFTGGTSPYEYEVDFGDGTLKISGTEQGSFINLTHVYDKPGTYTVNIVVKDKVGKTATLTQSVTVKDCTPLPSVYHHNFIIGYPDKTVRPDRFVSRVEVAAMILRALGIDATKLSDDILPFKDIPVTHWAYNFTRRIYQEGLMQGDSKGQFNPDKFATRAEIATILVRLGHIEPDYSDPLFSDIKKTDWFTPYVNAAVEAGLLTGYPDRTFRPNNSVTRAEFAAMLERILGREDIPQLKQFEGKENIIVWNDISPSHWAYYIMLEAWQPHIVTNVARAQGNITVKSKSIPVYITTNDSKVIIPKIGDTIRAIVPVDGIINGTDPAEREVFVKIISKEKP
ncbi:MAG: DUF11 domain-containing protein, partial [Caldisericum sp.]|nr:DUF11 domain-containing protein [Caldisericum sp.]